MSGNDNTANLVLPLARVKRIIKSDPDVKLVSADANFLIAKVLPLPVHSTTQSTELFLEYLAVEAEKEAKAGGKKTITYDDLYVSFLCISSK
jgi:histone H3/H4